MNKYQAAQMISYPRPGIAKVSVLPLAKRVSRVAGPDMYFPRLHEAGKLRVAAHAAAVKAVQDREIRLAHAFI